jgi:hypothetical protein
MKHRLIATVSFTAMVSLLAALLNHTGSAQRPGRNDHQKKNAEGIGPIYEIPKSDDLSARFTLARIKFEMLPYVRSRPHLGDGGYPWSHDYPGAGLHLMKILNELSKVNPTLEKFEPIFSFDDPELMKYPFAYLCEVGYMNLSDKEIAGMREYCLRGGFVMVDDFRGVEQLAHLRTYLKQAFPEFDIKKLDISHPIFNSFFSIKTLNLRPVYGGGYVSYETQQPEFWGLEDKDGRLMMVINYNYDVSDFWQWSDDPFSPIEETNESYKFGVNYIMYAMTH